MQTERVVGQLRWLGVAATAVCCLGVVLALCLGRAGLPEAHERAFVAVLLGLGATNAYDFLTLAGEEDASSSGAGESDPVALELKRRDLISIHAGGDTRDLAEQLRREKVEHDKTRRSLLKTQEELTSHMAQWETEKRNLDNLAESRSQLAEQHNEALSAALRAREEELVAEKEKLQALLQSTVRELTAARELAVQEQRTELLAVHAAAMDGLRASHESTVAALTRANELARLTREKTTTEPLKSDLIVEQQQGVDVDTSRQGDEEHEAKLRQLIGTREEQLCHKDDAVEAKMHQVSSTLEDAAEEEELVHHTSQYSGVRCELEEEQKAHETTKDELAKLSLVVLKLREELVLYRPEPTPEVDMSVMATRLISAFRMIVAIQRAKRLARDNLRPFTVRIVRATGFQAVDYVTGASDPFVIMTAMEPDPEAADGSMKQTMMYRTRVIKNSTNPVWNEEVCVSGCNGHATLVFTCLDKDLINLGSYDFLGQGQLSVATEDLWEDAEPFQVNVPFGRPTEEVFDEKGKRVRFPDEEAQGELTIELVPRKTSASVSGWCQMFKDNAVSFFGGKKLRWEPRWVVLSPEHGLMFHETPRNLNKVDLHIHPDEIEGVEMINDFAERNKVLKVYGRHDKKEFRFTFAREQEGNDCLRKLKIVQSKAEQERNLQRSRTSRRGSTFGSSRKMASSPGKTTVTSARSSPMVLKPGNVLRDDLLAGHRGAIDRIRAAHKQELSDLEEKYQRSLEAVRGDVKVEYEATLKAQLDEQQIELFADHHEALEEQRLELSRSHSAELEKAKAQIGTTQPHPAVDQLQALDAVESAHASELSELRRKHEADFQEALESNTAALEAKHAADLRALQDRLREEHEAQVGDLVADHVVALGAHRTTHEQDLQALEAARQQHEDEKAALAADHEEALKAHLDVHHQELDNIKADFEARVVALRAEVTQEKELHEKTRSELVEVQLLVVQLQEEIVALSPPPPLEVALPVSSSNPRGSHPTSVALFEEKDGGASADGDSKAPPSQKT